MLYVLSPATTEPRPVRRGDVHAFAKIGEFENRGKQVCIQAAVFGGKFRENRKRKKLQINGACPARHPPFRVMSCRACLFDSLLAAACKFS
jgi:hypothetical protein